LNFTYLYIVQRNLYTLLLNMECIRVRNILSHMDTPSRAALKKLLPKKLLMPEAMTAKYPSAILSIFPKEECYSLLGFVSEELLRLSVENINLASLHTAIQKYYPAYTSVHNAKVSRSKTTQPFLDIIKATRVKLDRVVKGTLIFDTVVRHEAVMGHPDAQTETQLFEVKMTGMLKKNWVDFLFQLFAYAALHDAATEVHLVLPLQQTIWSYVVKDWSQRTAYRDFLNRLSTARQDATVIASPIPGQLLQITHNIGNHVHKQKTMTATIQSLTLSVEKPFQCFLSGTQNTRVNIRDEELVAAAAVQQASGVRLYVHSPYIINLCNEPGTKEDYGVTCLSKNLQYANTMGLKGVVVHVGKSTHLDMTIALNYMRTNLLLSLESATVECPILLETPAGQGTETLTTYKSFVEFVRSFNSPKLRICVDTCHVYASGHNPLDYIQKLTVSDPGLLKLVHFNDSSTSCGSCLDRHAYIGTGKIGFETMKTIADYCKEHKIPMLVE